MDGGDLVQAGDASSQMKMTLKKLGLPPEIIRKASVCMYEGEINMVIHADGGRVEVEVGMDAITIRLSTRAPAFPMWTGRWRRATLPLGTWPGTWGSGPEWACPT